MPKQKPMQMNNPITPLYSFLTSNVYKYFYTHIRSNTTTREVYKKNSQNTKRRTIKITEYQKVIEPQL